MPRQDGTCVVDIMGVVSVGLPSFFTLFDLLDGSALLEECLDAFRRLVTTLSMKWEHSLPPTARYYIAWEVALCVRETKAGDSAE